MRILFLTTGYIHKTNNGGASFSNRNFKLLEKYIGSENLYFATINEMEIPISDRVRRFHRESKTVRVYLNCLFSRDGYSKKTERDVVNYIHSLDIDIVFVDTSRLGTIIKKLDPHIRIILFMQNVEKEYMWQRVVNGNILCVLRYLEVWYNEQLSINQADRLICLNERDGREVDRIYHRKPDLLMPISFTDRYNEDKQKMTENQTTLLFVGSKFLPNVRGIEWFVKNVMPNIQYSLKIIGNNMETMREFLASDRIEVVGTVDDLDKYYYEADAVIMPIFLGSGMKVKCAEAMMFGKNIFATDEALEGYDISNLSSIHRCNTAEEFVVAINQFEKESNCNKYCSDVRNLFLANYETGRLEESFFNLLNTL